MTRLGVRRIRKGGVYLLVSFVGATGFEKIAEFNK